MSSFHNIIQNQLMIAKLMFKEKAKEIERAYGVVIEEVIDYCQSRIATQTCWTFHGLYLLTAPGMLT